MDYSDDSCLSTFTPQQITRMQSAYADIRVAYIPGTGGEGDDQPIGSGDPHGGKGTQ
jgi:hypothetical protein